MYAVVLVFSFLTICFSNVEYRKRRMRRSAFLIIAALETTAILFSAALLLRI